MTTAVVESTKNEQAPASWLLDTLPVGFAPPRREDVPTSRLESRWVPDPRGEQGRICIWLHRTGREVSASSLDHHFRTRF